MVTLDKENEGAGWLVGKHITNDVHDCTLYLAHIRVSSLRGAKKLGHLNRFSLMSDDNAIDKTRMLMAV